MNDGGTLLERYVGSPIYGMAPEHGMAVLLVFVLVIAALVARRLARRGGRRSGSIVSRYGALSSVHRLLAWLLAISAAMNLGMALGRLDSGVGVWLLVVAVAELIVLRRFLSGRTWRRILSTLLITTLTINIGLAVAGVTVDQIGFMTALLEATALAVVMRSVEGGKFRRVVASLTVIGAIGFTTLAGWGGAVVAGIGGEKVGETPLPAVLLPVGTDRPPNEAERQAADRFHEQTVVAIEKYEDVSVAAADGYQVGNMVGSQFHAENPERKSDGVILDPDRPETLVYEPTPDGPVLLGALYEMESIGDPGPMFAGPIAVWHAHDHICFGSVPLTITGFESPLGVCPLGSLSVPITNEMIHVWTIPGVDDPYSELDDDWLAAYLERKG
ncbi:MAG: hypothetical protein BMS9Abin12_0809 [Acidimicrobiia bacterium]|nr:MAG: hypothetical protein BMS9Abin12_0809 [Acidimicrobiia bacterium]